MTIDQVLTLVVLVAVIGAMIWDRVRADVVAMAASAFLLMTGIVRPVDAQAAFASPAIIALASLFVIAYALELSGLLDRAIALGVATSRTLGAAGLWLMIGAAGIVSCFLNSTPVVVLAAPVVRDVAKSLRHSPQRYLIPLSYVTVLGGCCSLVGTSTNLLVDDMARMAGQPRFGIFEITPVGLPMALAGGLYLWLISRRLLPGRGQDEPRAVDDDDDLVLATGQVGNAQLFARSRPLAPRKAALALATFVGCIAVAAAGIAPIAATAFAGAVLLIMVRVISADEAYGGLRPQILVLIAGMVVVGLAVDQSGLATLASGFLIQSVDGLSPTLALVVLYTLTVVMTELLSNATVAVLVTPVAVALAQSLGVSPRPYLVAVMMGASAAFATPFGYQTNVIVYQMGGYRYLDFVRIGLPLNVISGSIAIVMIRLTFPY